MIKQMNVKVTYELLFRLKTGSFFEDQTPYRHLYSCETKEEAEKIIKQSYDNNPLFRDYMDFAVRTSYYIMDED